jgi:hypothetical protein
VIERGIRGGIKDRKNKGKERMRNKGRDKEEITGGIEEKLAVPVPCVPIINAQTLNVVYF